jgi:predicted DNA-binding protein (UPF0251 family)/predicted Fe-Mo cluster-binding NifX family protein
MPRPAQTRTITSLPVCGLFKPAGAPARDLESVHLSCDELEALRLADFEGLYQSDAAGRMGVSRATFGRIVTSARRKVASALIEGRALRIEGGSVELAATRRFACGACGHVWQVPCGTGRPPGCPACGSTKIARQAPPAAAAPASRRGPAQGEHAMKIAITAQQASMDAEVDPRFGRAKVFALVDTETGEAAFHDNAVNLNAAQGAGIQSARKIAELGVEAVLTGQVGPKAHAALSAAGVAIYAGASGTVAHAVEQFKAGKLTAAGDATVEGHWK